MQVLSSPRTPTFSSPAAGSRGFAYRGRSRSRSCAITVQSSIGGRDNSELFGAWSHNEQSLGTFDALMTAQGLIVLPPLRRPVSLRRKLEGLPTADEQGLCLGSTFDIFATNGKDPMRRFKLFGFCRSPKTIEEVVEDAVLQRGGGVLIKERQSMGMSERLMMTVAVPFLWGVPPELETVCNAVVMGGGIVEKVSQEWGIYHVN